MFVNYIGWNINKYVTTPAIRAGLNTYNTMDCFKICIIRYNKSVAHHNITALNYSAVEQSSCSSVTIAVQREQLDVLGQRGRERAGAATTRMTGAMAPDRRPP